MKPPRIDPVIAGLMAVVLGAMSTLFVAVVVVRQNALAHQSARIAQENHEVLQLVRSAVLPGQPIHDKGQQQSAQIVKELLEAGTHTGHDQAERICQLTAYAKLVPVLDPTSHLDLCPNGHAPLVP